MIQIPFWITDEIELDILKKVVEWLTIARDYVKDSLKSHYEHGGEVRAYESGRGDYQQLVDGIKDKAIRDGWPGIVD